MHQIFDKIILFICSLSLYIFCFHSEYFIIPMLVSLLFSSICTYTNKKVQHLAVFLLYLIICSFQPDFCLFLPFIIYDILFCSLQYSIFFIFPVLGMQLTHLTNNVVILIILLCILTLYLKYKTYQVDKLHIQCQKIYDDNTEFELLQEERNRNLLENQDYEINIATLNERNRISKEIHDHVGHLLSRSLIQIGALMTISKDEFLTGELKNLKDSLSEGMDSIRASIHNMHDESIDLYSSIQTLVKEFQFCEVDFTYDVDEIPLLKIKYCFIAIVKESLANIMKHSDATHVAISLKEYAAFYELKIADNGTINEKTKAIARRVQINSDYVEGMGLQNMIDRVKGFDGTFQIRTDHGFEISVTIMKM